MTPTTGSGELRTDEGIDRLASRKRAASDFLRLVATGRTDEAFEKFVARGFIHHNPHFESDADSLKAAMADNARQFPQKALDVMRVIGEGDLVAVHALVHIFRFEGDRVAELWDIGMEVPADMKNTRGMF